MSTTTTSGWDIPADPIAPQRGRDPYAAPSLSAAVPAPDDGEPAAKPTKARGINPISQWWEDMQADIAARKRRGDGRWWFMRWMNEQPTSVADYVDFILNQRDERPGGRRGWGLRTMSPLVNGVHAFFFVVYRMAVGLPLTLITYATGWMAQRPLGFVPLLVALYVVHLNLTTWLAAGP